MTQSKVGSGLGAKLSEIRVQGENLPPRLEYDTLRRRLTKFIVFIQGSIIEKSCHKCK